MSDDKPNVSTTDPDDWRTFMGYGQCPGGHFQFAGEGTPCQVCGKPLTLLWPDHRKYMNSGGMVDTTPTESTIHVDWSPKPPKKSKELQLELVQPANPPWVGELMDRLDLIVALLHDIATSP